MEMVSKVRRLRILIGPELFFPDVFGGGEQFAYNVAKNLVKRGNEVHVLAPRTSTAFPSRLLPVRETIEGVNVHRVIGRFQYRSSQSVIPYLTRLQREAERIIRDEKIEIVNPHAFRPCLPLYVASCGKVPSVATFHDVYSRGHAFGAENWIRIYGAWGTFGWGLEQVILKLPYTRVATVSNTVKTKLKRYFDGSRIDVVFCGIDLSIFPPRRTQKVSGRVLYLGRMIQYKNVHDAIAAMDVVRKKNKDAHILLAGSGPLSREISRLCMRREYARYVGRVDQDEKIRLLSEAQITVLPSSEEGWGISLMEANAAFTPYVAYDIPAVGELTSTLRGGMLAEHRNTRDLAAKMSVLIENPEIGVSMAQQARSMIEREFTWEAVASRMEDSFNEALNSDS
jgi:glycosyltransferase involved in cell wall biosynthesis